MQSITHLIDSIEYFSKQNFKFSKFFDLFKLIKHFPASVSERLNDSDFIFHLNEAISHMNWLNHYFEKYIIPSLKRESSKLKNSNNDKTIPYADFFVDKKPVFKKDEPIQISFDDILRNSLKDGSPLSPVKRRNPSQFSFQGVCPFCGAPHDYIYDNNGKGQYKCKACHNTFTTKTSVSGETGIYCPHCGCKLDLKHDRNGYNVFICPSYKCPYYLKNKECVDSGNGEHLRTSSQSYRLHYHYRDFKFNLDDLKKTEQNTDTPVNLSKIHYDHKVLGLVLTYYVNYGLSARKTALILQEVHGCRISHQTVMNYAKTVSILVKPLVDNYPYKLSSVLSGDETYIKVKGKNNYVFFWSDPYHKIITSYTIYPVRDTRCACQSIHDCLRHYEAVPEDMLLITDGNPIYNASQLFFELYDIHFDLQQVIGVKNHDETSKKYRPFKQIEERLNRTYKHNYNNTNGYDNLESANHYMVLFVCFFNFLRKHSSLGYKTPVDDNLFDEGMLIQDKWLKLIEYSSQYHVA